MVFFLKSQFFEYQHLNKFSFIVLIRCLILKIKNILSGSSQKWTVLDQSDRSTGVRIKTTESGRSFYIIDSYIKLGHSLIQCLTSTFIRKYFRTVHFHAVILLEYYFGPKDRPVWLKNVHFRAIVHFQTRLLSLPLDRSLWT